MDNPASPTVHVFTQTGNSQQMDSFDEEEEVLTYSQISDYLPFFDLKPYDIVSVIGYSNHKVYEFQNKYNRFPQYIAAKQILVPSNQDEMEELKCKLNQMYKIQSTNHPNIIQVYGFCQTRQPLLDGSDQIFYFICMEFMQYNLQQRIEKINQNEMSASEEEFEYLLYNLAEGFSFLQTLGLCHSDIKPSNILINCIENPTQLKICDLDTISEYLSQTRYQSYSLTTFLYQAPEIRQAIQLGIEQIQFNAFKADVYSMGLCLIQMHHLNKIEEIHGLTDQTRWLQFALQHMEETYGKKLNIIIERTLNQVNHHRPDFIGIGSYLAKEGMNQEQFTQRKILIESLKDTNHYYFALKHSLESRGTVDLIEKRKKRALIQFLQESERTISSNQSQVASFNATPRNKQNLRQVTGFNRQLSEVGFSQNNLQTSIESILEENDSPPQKQLEFQKKYSLSKFSLRTQNLRLISQGSVESVEQNNNPLKDENFEEVQLLFCGDNFKVFTFQQYNIIILKASNDITDDQNMC